MLYFHHFHKAAGTCIVDYLTKTHAPVAQHKNGNPVDGEGFCVELWKYCPEQLSEFLDRTHSSGATLIVTEWGIANAEVFRNKGYTTLTVLRDPLERLISNYRFDYIYHNFTGSFANYITNPAIPYQRADYYSVELSQRLLRDRTNSPMSAEHLAKWLHGSFDEILYLEGGHFRKIKDQHIVDVQQLEQKNAIGLLTKVRQFRSAPSISSSELRLARNRADPDYAVLDYLVRYTGRPTAEVITEGSCVDST